MSVGMDIGYGYSKAVCGEVRAVFPSVIGKAEGVRYETELHRQLAGGHVSEGQGMILIAEEGDRFVGELALLQSSVQWTLLDRSRVKDPFGPAAFSCCAQRVGRCQ